MGFMSVGLLGAGAIATFGARTGVTERLTGSGAACGRWLSSAGTALP